MLLLNKKDYSSVANWHIAETPRFLTTPQDVTTAIGNSVHLPCRATGYPEPQISWSKNGAPLVPSGRINIISNGDLHVNNIHAEDRGSYRCTAENGGGTTGSVARIIIHGKLKLPWYFHKCYTCTVVHLLCLPYLFLFLLKLKALKYISIYSKAIEYKIN